MLFTAALLVSSVLTHYVRNTALKHGWTCSTIRGGTYMPAPFRGWVALAICVTFMTVAISYVAFYRLRGIGTGFGIYTTFAVLAPASLMFILGLVDDARNLGPQVKFGVQIIAGLLLYYGGIRIYFFPIIAGYHELNSVISMILTVMWVLLISNAFNLIDGLDGLSAGSALFSTLVVFVVSLFSGNPFVAVMSVTLAGAILGFLRYNFNPATIFLGDSGSLFLGFMLERRVAGWRAEEHYVGGGRYSDRLLWTAAAGYRSCRSFVAFLADSHSSPGIASISITSY